MILDPVLDTKFFVPPLRADAVERPHLIEKLKKSLARPSGFSLIAGPPGSGKTTLLSQFVSRCGRQVAWLSLDEADNDPARFWTFVIRACRSAGEDIGGAVLELLESQTRCADEAIPTLLINDLSAQVHPLLLVLDDYHTIQHASIQTSLLFLLEHLPPQLSVTIATRTDPPWPLGRFRARNQMHEIRARDLRFSEMEALHFLNHTMGLSLPSDDAAMLEARTEGWIAGLQLAALSLQGRKDVGDFVRAFGGSQLYVAEYLIEEILQQQPRDVTSFLLETSILDRLQPDLCAVVAGREGDRNILWELHRANIFIIPLDDEGQWFRYHHLFADLLRAQLKQRRGPDTIGALHLRAAAWYAQHGYLREAVSHSLTAQDFGRAAQLVDEVGAEMMFRDHNTLRSWLDALPAEAFQRRPRLEIYRFLIELSQGKLDMQEETLREKEALIGTLPPSPANDRLRLEASVYLSLFLAHQNTVRTIDLAEAALAKIPDRDLRLRAFLHSALYRAHGMEGNLEQATRAYRECVRMAQQSGQIGMLSVTTMVRAFDLCQYARLEEAAQDCEAILALGEARKSQTFYQAGPAHIGLAGLYLERYELTQAEQQLAQGLELCRQGAMDGIYTGYLQQARLQQAQGNLEAAWITLQRLEQNLRRRDFTLTIRQVSLRLAMDDPVGAGQLIHPILEVFEPGPYADSLPLIAREAYKLCLARIYIGQGESSRVPNLLDEVQATAEPDGRLGRLMEVLLLRALAAHQAGAAHGTTNPHTLLAQALQVAERAGFVLLLLEEGPRLRSLLAGLATDTDVPEGSRRYAHRLLRLAAGEDARPRSHGDAPDLIETLTPREMEVLQCLAAGDSNQAIADELVITVRTVKKHVTNILGKLAAQNRTQAVARARELGLLAP